MQSMLSFILLLALLVAPHAARAETADMVVVTESNEPFNYLDGETVVGLSTDIFMEMTRRADIDFRREDINLWPWARGYRELNKRDNVILYSTARVPAREGLFQWIGPITALKCVLIAPKEKKVRFNSLTQAALKYRIGSIRDTAPEQAIIRDGVLPESLERVHDPKLNIRKLLDGRIDAMLFNETAIMLALKKAGAEPRQYEVVHTLFTTDLYFAASKNMDPKLVARLQCAMDAMRADGTLDVIVHRYRP